jgi:hypothetical protein
MAITNKQLYNAKLFSPLGLDDFDHVPASMRGTFTVLVLGINYECDYCKAIKDRCKIYGDTKELRLARYLDELRQAVITYHVVKLDQEVYGLYYDLNKLINDTDDLMTHCDINACSTIYVMKKGNCFLPYKQIIINSDLNTYTEQNETATSMSIISVGNGGKNEKEQFEISKKFLDLFPNVRYIYITNMMCKRVFKQAIGNRDIYIEEG